MVGQLEVDMPEGSTLEDLLSHLAIELEPESLLLVVNGRNEEKSYVLSEMDKVNLMPVLSGGCL